MPLPVVTLPLGFALPATSIPRVVTLVVPTPLGAVGRSRRALPSLLRDIVFGSSGGLTVLVWGPAVLHAARHFPVKDIVFVVVVGPRVVMLIPGLLKGVLAATVKCVLVILSPDAAIFGFFAVTGEGVLADATVVLDAGLDVVVDGSVGVRVAKQDAVVVGLVVVPVGDEDTGSSCESVYGSLNQERRETY